MPEEEGSLDNRKEACDSPTGQKEEKKGRAAGDRGGGRQSGSLEDS